MVWSDRPGAVNAQNFTPRDRRPGVKEVVVSRTIDAPREAVEAVLSPTALVEHAGTYEVWDVDREADEVVVTAGTADLEVCLAFTETETGYIYRQRGEHGPFEAMYASVSVAEDAPTVVTARSCFTFGMPLARLTDWIAARERRTELRRMLTGIERAIVEAGVGPM